MNPLQRFVLKLNEWHSQNSGRPVLSHAEASELTKGISLSEREQKLLIWLLTSTYGLTIINQLLKKNIFHAAIHFATSSSENTDSRIALIEAPCVKHIISLHQLDPNLFLWAAASNETEETPEENIALLTHYLYHPHCNPYSYNKIGYQLTTANSGIIPTFLDIIQQAQQNAIHACNGMHIRLENLFLSENTLPHDAALDTYQQFEIRADDTISATHSQRTQHQIQWIINNPRLEAWRIEFRGLLGNLKKLNSATTALLTSICQHLKRQLEQDPDQDIPYPTGGDGGLRACETGIFSQLAHINNALSGQSAASIHVLEVINDTLQHYFLLASTHISNEVHFPQTLITMLGTNPTKTSYDPHVITYWSPTFIKAIVQTIYLRLLTNGNSFLPAHTIEILNSYKGIDQLNTLIPEQNDTFNTLRDTLFSSGIFIENEQEEVDTKEDIKDFIQSSSPNLEADEEENYTIIVRDDLISATKRQSEQHLEKKHILAEKAELNKYAKLLWAFLTTTNQDDTEHTESLSFISHCAQKNDGLACLYYCLYQRSAEELNTIIPAKLLYVDNSCPTSVFEQLASNPTTLEFMYGITFVANNAGARDTYYDIYFDIKTDPSKTNTLKTCLGKIQPYSAEEKALEAAYNRLLTAPIPPTFWLHYLSNPANGYTDLNTCMQSFFKDQGASISRYHSFLDILHKMKQHMLYDSTPIINAFLKNVLKKQVALRQYNAYWKTLSLIDSKTLPDSDQKLLPFYLLTHHNDKEQWNASLENPDNKASLDYFYANNKNIQPHLIHAISHKILFTPKIEALFTNEQKESIAQSSIPFQAALLSIATNHLLNFIRCFDIQDFKNIFYSPNALSDFINQLPKNKQKILIAHFNYDELYQIIQNGYPEDQQKHCVKNLNPTIKKWLLSKACNTQVHAFINAPGMDDPAEKAMTALLLEKNRGKLKNKLLKNIYLSRPVDIHDLDDLLAKILTTASDSTWTLKQYHQPLKKIFAKVFDPNHILTQEWPRKIPQEIILKHKLQLIAAFKGSLDFPDLNSDAFMDQLLKIPTENRITLLCSLSETHLDQIIPDKSHLYDILKYLPPQDGMKLIRLRGRTGNAFNTSNFQLDIHMRYVAICKYDDCFKNGRALLSNYVHSNAFGRFFSGHINHSNRHIRAVKAVLNNPNITTAEGLIRAIAAEGIDILKLNHKSSLYRRLTTLAALTNSSLFHILHAEENTPPKKIPLSKVRHDHENLKYVDHRFSNGTAALKDLEALSDPMKMRVDDIHQLELILTHIHPKYRMPLLTLLGADFLNPIIQYKEELYKAAATLDTTESLQLVKLLGKRKLPTADPNPIEPHVNQAMVDTQINYMRFFAHDTSLANAKELLSNYLKGNFLGRLLSGHWNRTTKHLNAVKNTLKDKSITTIDELIAKLIRELEQQHINFSTLSDNSSLKRRLNLITALHHDEERNNSPRQP